MDKINPKAFLCYVPVYLGPTISQSRPENEKVQWLPNINSTTILLVHEIFRVGINMIIDKLMAD
jgi:hypothetical protein